MISGQRLKKLRKDNNLTLDELGNKLELDKSTLSCYENEQRSPSIKELKKIMQLFKVSSDYLIGADYMVVKEKKEDFQADFVSSEELELIVALRQNKNVHDILISDPKRGAQLIINKIG